MYTIKTKEMDKTIHTLNRQKDIEKSTKKAEIKNIKVVHSTQGNNNDSSNYLDGSKSAIDKITNTEKRTVAYSSYYAKKYYKNKINFLKNIKMKEKIKEQDKTAPLHLKNSIKNKKKSTHISTKLTNSTSQQIKNSYSSSMKYLSIRNKQKKMMSAAKKASTITKKAISKIDGVSKVTFKIMSKAISSINNLLSIGGALILIIVLILFISIFASLSSDSSIDTSTLPLSSEVIAHTETIRKYAVENNIEEYVPLIQAIMMQESKGLGNDPMQASVCEYNTKYPRKPNGIQDSDYSIKIGIKYFSDCLKKSKAKDELDMQKIYLALQGYNYGKEYIAWAVTNFNGYTRANAKVYSDEKKAELNVTTYGDPHYVSNVLRYYKLGGNGQIVEVALSQLGNIGGKPYWSWWGYSSRVEWCAIFVSYV